jgi:hypothetical protein
MNLGDFKMSEVKFGATGATYRGLGRMRGCDSDGEPHKSIAYVAQDKSSDSNMKGVSSAFPKKPLSGAVGGHNAAVVDVKE